MRLWSARSTYFNVLLALTLSILTCVFLSAKNAFAEENTISISLSSGAVSLDIIPGEFSSASETMDVSTTNAAGYTVTLSTMGSSTSLINSDGTSTVPTFTLPPGATQLPADATGYGYGYSIDGGNFYLPVPDPSGSGDKIFSSNASGTYSHILTFGVKVDANILAGLHTNTFLVTATTNDSPACPINTICYNGNGDDGTGTMTDQLVSSNSSAMLIPSNFSRPGYGFAGWNTKENGTGTNYGPGETIETGDLSALGLTLYARWVQPLTDMQNWSGCSSINIGDVIGLRDLRDGNVYAVSKLADGNCWMVENMRVDPSSAKITAANTNSPTADFLNKVPASAPSSALCSSNDSGCIDSISYNLNNINRSLAPNYNSNSTSSWFSYGGMYNWYTATAGNGTFATGGNTSTSGDVCPAGWRLPTGGNNGEWASFNRTVNSGSSTNDTGLRSYPNNFSYSGDYNANAPTGRGNQGRFWSSSSNSNDKAFRLGYGNNTVTPANAYNKWVAFSVRCVVKSNNQILMGNIHYDANGGTGTMPDTTNVNLNTVTAAKNLFTRAGKYKFSGWNTAADGSGVYVADEDMVSEAAKAMGITTGGTLTLYAIWGNSATLAYDANGGKGAPKSTSTFGDESWSFIISSVVPTRMDYEFLGWSTDPSATSATYSSGGTFTTTNENNTLYAVWSATPCPAGKLCYRGNGADVGSSLTQSVSSGADITLYSNNYLRAGYGFSGWNTAADGTGTTYGPNEIITVGDVSTNGMILYAMWVASAGNLQNWGGCNSLSIGDVTALTDARDNNTYTVAKLADNKCWTVENLRLVPSGVSFTAANTNSPTQEFINRAPSSSTSTKLCNSNTSECIDQIAFDSMNVDGINPPSPTANNSQNSWLSYGVMYNWYTATAGNGTYSVSNGSVSGDICPAGWRLPTGGNDGEYKALNTTIGGSTNLLKYPVNFVYSGDHNTSSDGGRGKYGRLWSSTASKNDAAYRMGFQDGTTTPANTWNKWTAFAVRCVAQ